jgi:TolB-like protein/DNA-binding winged helix-turn-helix (wHTH) protein/Tfp pilus assembly protein PilF
MSESQYKFAEFQLDCASFELRRQGRAQKSERISLERIPMELLILLLERQGSVVTRQEIVDRLWGKDVFVDTEHGINTAIRKVRQALKDDSDNPRFVHTVSGKGYRFVTEENGHPPYVTAVAAVPPEAPQPMWGQPPRLSGGAEVSRRSPDARDVAAVEITPTRTKRAIAAGALCLITAAALIFILRGRIFRTNQAAQIHSIAVIPLANLSGDPTQEYFADGMTDELITALAKNRSLRIVSRTSAMRYKGVSRPLRDIARELGVDGILEGSIERSANRVHMTVQLIYAPTDTHLWAESYDRDLNQAISLPEELSATVAKEVKIMTSPAPPQRYINPEAHDAYLQGLQFWYGKNVRGGLPYFEKAIQLQPDYAAAWSGLADTYAVLSVGGEVPSSEVKEQWESSARKAVELDDSLPQAHNTMAGWYLYYARDWQRAEAESLRSLALDLRFAEGYHMHSYILTVTNRLAEAIEEQKRGTSIDPFARPWALGYTYFHARQFENAVNELRLRVAAQPADPTCHQILSESYHFLGRDKEAIAELEQALLLFGQKDAVPIVQRAFERGGFAAVAAWQADNQPLAWQGIHNRPRTRWDVNPPKKYVSPYWRAISTARARRKEQTLQLLDEADLAHDPRMIFLQNEPAFDFLHHEPRYQTLIQKLGLPPAY